MCLFSHLVVDAWGKFPSGILEGNLFELGSFQECFHIERDDEPYDTKYCLAELKLKSTPQSRLSLRFGMCTPAICSMHFLQSMINNNKSIDRLTSLKFDENTCQLEENVSELKVLDWITMYVYFFHY